MVKKGEKRNVTWTPNPKGNPNFGSKIKFPSKYGKKMTKKVHLHLPDEDYEQLLRLVEDSPGLTLQDIIRRELRENLKEYAKSL